MTGDVRKPLGAHGWKRTYLVLLFAFAVGASAAQPPSKPPSRDACVVVPLLQAFTSADAYEGVLRILGEPDFDIGSASPLRIFALTDGSHIKVRTLSRTKIKDIALYPAHRAVIEGEGKLLFDAVSRDKRGQL